MRTTTETIGDLLRYFCIEEPRARALRELGECAWTSRVDNTFGQSKPARQGDVIESPRTGRLVSFTLDEVPLPIRRQAARAARSSPRAADNLVHAEDRVFAALLAGGHDDLLEAAERPSGRVYWITREAWQRVMG